LKKTFSAGGPPHQLLAFAFCKILEDRPQTFVQRYSGSSLHDLEEQFERKYTEETGEDRFFVAKALNEFRQSLDHSFEAVTDPLSRTTFRKLYGQIVGRTTPKDYYRTETPEESVSHWVYAVRRRIQKALSSDAPIK